MIFKRMREQILDKAIRGQLVPQLAEDGVVDQIGEDPSEVPFELPASWKWLTLEAIGFWKAGATPSRSVKEYYENGTIPWLKTGDLTDGIISTVEEQITQDALDSCTAHINPKGSVLIAMYGATIGKLGILDIDCATNQACCACQVNSSLIYNWYLFYYLMSQRAKFIAQGVGGAQPNISKAKIIVYPIPLPPLAEQKRIASRVTELFTEIDRAEKAYEELQSLANVLRGQILQKAIQGKLIPQLPEDGVVEQIGEAPAEVPFDIPNSWKWVTLDTIGLFKKGPFGSSLTKSIFVPKSSDSVRVYEQKNAIDKDANWARYYISREYFEAKMCSFTATGGDTIISCAGTIGEVFTLPKNAETGVINQALMRVRLNELVSSEFFSLVFKALIKELCRKESGGTAIKNIPPFKIFKAFPFPLPPLAEQKRIVAKVETLIEQIDLMTK